MNDDSKYSCSGILSFFLENLCVFYPAVLFGIPVQSRWCFLDKSKCDSDWVCAFFLSPAGCNGPQHLAEQFTHTLPAFSFPRYICSCLSADGRVKTRVTRSAIYATIFCPFAANLFVYLFLMKHRLCDETSMMQFVTCCPSAEDSRHHSCVNARNRC